MRILIITFSYLPAITPRAIRWSAIARYWAKQGVDVDVVCSWAPGLQRIDNLYDVKVYRVGGSAIENIRGRLTNSNNYLDSGSELKTRGRSGFVKRAVVSTARFIHDRTWKKVYWPDYACLWYFPAFRKAKQLYEAKGYDCIISVSPPFTGHLVGLSIKKTFKNVKWLVDSGDPFCFMDLTPVNNQKIYNSLNHSIEKSVFQLSDSISVTTDKTAMRYCTLFPDIDGKIKVIPPVIDGNFRYGSFKPDSNLLQIKTILSFYGNLYPTIRKPDTILEVLVKLVSRYPKYKDKIKFNFFGEPGFFKEQLNRFQKEYGIVCVQGKVSRDLVAKTMAESHFLINIGNATDYQLPSKVIEYMGTGKPIINISTIKNDSSAEALKSYPLHFDIRAYDEIDGQIPGLSVFIDDNKGKVLDGKDIERLISIFQVPSVSKKYMVLVEK